MTSSEIRCAAAAAADAAVKALPLDVHGLTAMNIEACVRDLVESWLVEEE